MYIIQSEIPDQSHRITPLLADPHSQIPALIQIDGQPHFAALFSEKKTDVHTPKNVFENVEVALTK